MNTKMDRRGAPGERRDGAELTGSLAGGDDSAALDPALLEKYDRESAIRHSLPTLFARVVSVLAVLLAIFHLYTSTAGPLIDIQQRSIHLYTLLALAFVLYPFTRKGARDRVPVRDVILALVAIGIGIYMIFSTQRIILAAGRITDLDMVIGIVAILLVLDATRRVTGWGRTSAAAFRPIARSSRSTCRVRI